MYVYPSWTMFISISIFKANIEFAEQKTQDYSNSFLFIVMISALDEIEIMEHLINVQNKASGKFPSWKARNLNFKLIAQLDQPMTKADKSKTKSF